MWWSDRVAGLDGYLAGFDCLVELRSVATEAIERVFISGLEAPSGAWKYDRTDVAGFRY